MKQYLTPALGLYIFFIIAFGGTRAVVAIVLATVVVFLVGLVVKHLLDYDIYSKRGG